jgi:hypothetical protein
VPRYITNVLTSIASKVSKSLSQVRKEMGQSGLLIYSLPLPCVTGDGTPLVLPSEDKTFVFERDGLASEIKVCQ